jgi:hypothetical protein
VKLKGSVESPKRVGYLLIVALALTGCNVDQPPVPNRPPLPKPATAPHSRLRVRNVGSLAIRELIVMFPSMKVRFGDVEKGATTRYVDVPSGVYRYAALRHSWEGRAIMQSVIDWHGERPYPVGLYTYLLRVEPYGDGGTVFLVDVLRDPSVGDQPTPIRGATSSFRRNEALTQQREQVVLPPTRRGPNPDRRNGRL